MIHPAPEVLCPTWAFACKVLGPSHNWSICLIDMRGHAETGCKTANKSLNLHYLELSCARNHSKRELQVHTTRQSNQTHIHDFELLQVPSCVSADLHNLPVARHHSSSSSALSDFSISSPAWEKRPLLFWNEHPCSDAAPFWFLTAASTLVGASRPWESNWAPSTALSLPVRVMFPGFRSWTSCTARPAAVLAFWLTAPKLKAVPLLKHWCAWSACRLDRADLAIVLGICKGRCMFIKDSNQPTCWPTQNLLNIWN